MSLPAVRLPPLARGDNWVQAMPWTQRVGVREDIRVHCRAKLPRQSKGYEPPPVSSCWAPGAAGAQASWGNSLGSGLPVPQRGQML